MIEAEQLVEKLKGQLLGFDNSAVAEHVGTVEEVGDGIARISGLSTVSSMEMIDFGNEVFGVALNLEAHSVGAIILGDYLKVRQGDTVKATGKILSVPVGEHLIGF
jgi:F-type H+-transporting ATPase subunit alpha